MLSFYSTGFSSNTYDFDLKKWDKLGKHEGIKYVVSALRTVKVYFKVYVSSEVL